MKQTERKRKCKKKFLLGREKRKLYVCKKKVIMCTFFGFEPKREKYEVK
jgi:hypothetical protein